MSNFWLGGQFDARHWSGATLGTWGATAIVLPVHLDVAGPIGGIFETLESFLSGYGSPAWAADAENRRDMTSDLLTAWDGSASANIATLDIDPSTGHLRISVDGDYVQIVACSNPTAFGLDAADFPTPPVASYVFPKPFSRDLLQGETITFENEEGAIDPVPIVTEYEARILHLLRPASGSQPIDADDETGFLGLAYALNFAAGDTQSRVRCYLDDQRHVVISWPVGLAGEPSFTDEAFRRAMGITGLETVETVTVIGGQIKRLRGSIPAKGGYASPLGVAGPKATSIESRGKAADAGSNGAIGGSPGVGVATTIPIWLESPLGPTYDGDVDLQHHFERRFIQHIEPGYPVRIVRGKDWRRYLNPNDIDTTTPGAGLFYSTDCCKSAWRARRHKSDTSIQYTYERANGGMFTTARLKFVDNQS